jgi:hypothetical protein
MKNMNTWQRVEMNYCFRRVRWLGKFKDWIVNNPLMEDFEIVSLKVGQNLFIHFRVIQIE